MRGAASGVVAMRIEVAVFVRAVARDDVAFHARGAPAKCALDHGDHSAAHAPLSFAAQHLVFDRRVAAALEAVIEQGNGATVHFAHEPRWAGRGVVEIVDQARAKFGLEYPWCDQNGRVVGDRRIAFGPEPRSETLESLLGPCDRPCDRPCVGHAQGAIENGDDRTVGVVAVARGAEAAAHAAVMVAEAAHAR